MTEQQAVRKQIDNKEWAENWRVIESLKLLWAEMGVHRTFEEVINVVFMHHKRMHQDGEFQSERYSGHPSREYSKAILECLKEQE